MANKRERSTNWEKEEKQLLREIMKPHLNVIENKDLTTNTNAAKVKAWADITEKFNVMNSKKRDKRQLLNQWKTLKLQAKKEVSNYRREVKRTGGGPQPPSPSLEVMELVSLLPAEFAVDFNEFDCDGVKENVETVLTIDQHINVDESPMGNQETAITMELQKKAAEIPMRSPFIEKKDIENNESIDRTIEASLDTPRLTLPKRVKKTLIPRKKEFLFAEESFADMHHFRVLENERQQKEHELRMKNMSDLNSQVLKNLKLQEEILAKHLASLNK